MFIDQDGDITTAGGISIATIIIILLGGFTVLAMWGCPQYNVYTQRLQGEAALSKAEGQRQILVTQAHAEREAAALRAEAIKIVGQAAKDFPEYRQQEFIGAFAEALKDGHVAQIIYVPTEANIPIIEPGRIAAHANTK